jgi:type IV pilus assembly protein PilC
MMALYIKDIIADHKTRATSSPKSPSILQKEITWLSKPFTNKIKEDFYSEFHLLLKAGIMVKDALPLCKNGTKKETNKNIIETINQNILQGSNLFAAMEKEACFSQYEIYSIRIGEETGTLARITEQLASFYSKKNEQRRQLISTLTYPCIILTTAILVVIFMLSFVVPMFQDIFEQQNMDLPALTSGIIYLSALVKSYGWLLILSALFIVAGVQRLRHKVWFRRSYGLFLLRLPFFGPYIKKLNLSYFAQALGLLSASKVPLLNGISMVKDMVTFYPLKIALQDIEQRLIKGDSLSNSLSNHDIFDEKIIALVKVSEETNKTQYIFERLNYQFNTELSQQSKLLSTILEPLVILLVGLMVGIILIAMYLPMFKLSSLLG